MLDCLFVGIGGFIGAICRYLFGFIPLKAESGFPFKTLAVNLIGAFTIGVITAWVIKNESFSPRLELMLKVGVCGGFTTFSTFAFETAGLMQNGATVTAILYALSSVVLCVVAVFGAQLLVK